MIPIAYKGYHLPSTDVRRFSGTFLLRVVRRCHCPMPTMTFVLHHDCAQLSKKNVPKSSDRLFGFHTFLLVDTPVPLSPDRS